MSDLELAKQLAEESDKLVQAQDKYDKAKSRVLSWLERDIERSEGSGRQEASRERDYENLRSDQSDAESTLNHQKKIVAELAGKLK